jgi:phosphoglycerate dehydrogenase-like enzyme
MDRAAPALWLNAGAPASAGLAHAGAFARMKETAYLIKTARGGLTLR